MIFFAVHVFFVRGGVPKPDVRDQKAVIFILRGRWFPVPEGPRAKAVANDQSHKTRN